MWRRRVITLGVLAFAAVLVPRAPGVRAAISVREAHSCGALAPVNGAGPACTHGADPAPPGVDASVPQPLRSSEPMFTTAEATGAAPPPCYGNGTDGKRVQAMYVHPADKADRSSDVIPLIRQWAADVDHVFASSAAEVGGVRHVRFVTRADCSIDVGSATVSARGDDTIENTIAELTSKGFNRPDRKYLVWMDSTVLCGIASFYLDDRADSSNLNNGNSTVPGTVARIDSGCWGLASRGQSVESHELVHTLGGVQPTAPHATQLGHCYDESDRMCYDDGSPGFKAVATCPPDQEAFLDCGHDDYFHPAPASSSYLATHWNTARSEFLGTSVPAPPPTNKVTRVAGDDRVATAVASSRNAWSKGASATGVTVANDRSFADALTGVPLAARVGGPLLLTSRDALDRRVADEIRRVLKPGSTVYVLGGSAALADGTVKAIAALGFHVTRVAGANRFETAAMIAEQLKAPQVILEATGTTFADALAAGAAAAQIGAAVLLTDGATQSVATARYLAMHPTLDRYALGGPAASADPAARPLAGADRFATAVLVAKQFFARPSVVGLASGSKFPDALSGGANIAAHAGPMLLATPGAPLPQQLIDYLRDMTIDHAMLYGGQGALSDQVAIAVERLAES
ncbi:MAG: hypothetical protein V7636_975 [Actinomycetota bacterium]|jgi:hypothetical protein